MISLFLFVSFVSCLGPGNTVSQTRENSVLVNGVLRESVTLEFPTKDDFQFITWRHRETVIVVVEKNKTQTSVTTLTWKKQLKVIQPYALQINNLTMENEGPYHAHIMKTNSKNAFIYNLRIFRKLRNIQVANHTHLSENGTCEIHLICSVENPNDHASFKWQSTGNTCVEEANLTISWNPKNSSEQIYTCKAENPVSNLSFSLSVQSLCKGYFNEKNQLLSIIIWIIVVILICFTVGCFVWKKKVTGSSRISTQQVQSPAETLLNPVNEPASPGHTVYAQVVQPTTQMEIPMPMKNNDSTTVYTTVFQSRQGNSPRQHHQSCGKFSKEFRNDTSSPDPVGENRAWFPPGNRV